MQLVAYTLAICSFAPGEVEASLVFFRPDEALKVHSIDLDEPTFEEIRERADEFTAYLRAGPVEPGPYRPDCPF